MHLTEAWYVNHCIFSVLDKLFQVVFLFVGGGVGKIVVINIFSYRRIFFLLVISLERRYFISMQNVFLITYFEKSYHVIWTSCLQLSYSMCAPLTKMQLFYFFQRAF